MHMVLNPTNNNWLAIEVGQNAAKVTMQFMAERFVTQKGSPVFGGENGMNQDF
jgi:hypothetical protein